MTLFVIFRFRFLSRVLSYLLVCVGTNYLLVLCRSYAVEGRAEPRVYVRLLVPISLLLLRHACIFTLACVSV